MVVNKGKKARVAERTREENDHVDGDLVLSIEKLQEIQDELEKVRDSVALYLSFHPSRPLSPFFFFPGVLAEMPAMSVREILLLCYSNGRDSIIPILERPGPPHGSSSSSDPRSFRFCVF